MKWILYIDGEIEWKVGKHKAISVHYSSAENRGIILCMDNIDIISSGIYGHHSLTCMI